ncbi:hypothetical protein Thena_0546 [Thermodesulfobium narugense DSM 14796]|uniref:Transcriptional regulator HTH-type FeoC domain-containing protein n=1 Tax=Thermodesulfobium narugense DSM 14796 TaxID=747365 RepID=M1E7X3_9BACT|nr:hypothetical protein [Thermodesulfobium narugense]AEE14184.1 hypothetical protein Thena_0546 [Thermodesulfobium narugense DSM 14796]
MKEYILHLLYKDKGLTFDEILKKTNLQRDDLLQAIFNLTNENKVHYIDLSLSKCSICKICNKNFFVKGG